MTKEKANVGDECDVVALVRMKNEKLQKHTKHS